MECCGDIRALACNLAATQDPWASWSATAILKLLNIFEQGAPLFHFALGPTNYVASPGSEIWIQRDVDSILGLTLP